MKTSTSNCLHINDVVSFIEKENGGGGCQGEGMENHQMFEKQNLEARLKGQG